MSFALRVAAKRYITCDLQMDKNVIWTNVELCKHTVCLGYWWSWLGREQCQIFCLFLNSSGLYNFIRCWGRCFLRKMFSLQWLHIYTMFTQFINTYWRNIEKEDSALNNVQLNCSIISYFYFYFPHPVAIAVLKTSHCFILIIEMAG